VKALKTSQSGTPISRALHAQISHEHVGPWVVSNHIEFMCLRESSDSADPFISATAIQLTSSYTTHGYQSAARGKLAYGPADDTAIIYIHSANINNNSVP